MKKLLLLVAMAAFVFACNNAPKQDETATCETKKECCKKEGESKCCKEGEESKCCKKEGEEGKCCKKEGEEGKCCKKEGKECEKKCEGKDAKTEAPAPEKK